MKYVEIKDGVVISGPWTADSLPNLDGSGVLPVSIDGISPEPREHWTYDGTDFTEGFAPPPPVVPVENLRELRNVLLLESDWSILNYSPLSEANIALWVVYRQELRDLPDGYAPVADPVWPTPPRDSEAIASLT